MGPRVNPWPFYLLILFNRGAISGFCDFCRMIWATHIGSRLSKNGHDQGGAVIICICVIFLAWLPKKTYTFQANIVK